MSWVMLFLLFVAMGVSLYTLRLIVAFKKELAAINNLFTTKLKQAHVQNSLQVERNQQRFQELRLYVAKEQERLRSFVELSNDTLYKKLLVDQKAHELTFSEQIKKVSLEEQKHLEKIEKEQAQLLEKQKKSEILVNDLAKKISEEQKKSFEAFRDQQNKNVASLVSASKLIQEEASKSKKEFAQALGDVLVGQEKAESVLENAFRSILESQKLLFSRKKPTSSARESDC